MFDYRNESVLPLAETLPDDFRGFLRDVFTAKTRDRGMTYALGAHVVAIDLTAPHRIEAEVRGSDGQYYEVTLDNTDDGGELGTLCTCPVEMDCKHGAAVIYRLLAEAVAANLPWAEVYRSDLPRAWRRAAAEQLPVVAGNALSKLLGAWSASEGSGPASRKVAPWWERFAAAKPADRNRLLYEVLRAHVSGYLYVPRLDAVLLELANDTDPLHALVQFASFVRGLRCNVNKKSPLNDAAFKAFLDSDEAQASLRAVQARVTDQMLLEWLSEQEVYPDSTAVVEWRLVHTGLELPVLAYRYLLSSKKLNRSPRHAHALEQLAATLRSRQRVMRPAEFQLTKWLVEQHPTPADPFGDAQATDLMVHNLYDWLAHVPASLWSWSDGSPVRIAAGAPARLALAPDGEGFVWVIEVPRDDGVEAARVDGTDAELFFNRMPRYYEDTSKQKLWLRHEGWIRPVDTAGAPLELAVRLLRRRELPVALLRDSDAGARLVQRLERAGGATEVLAAETPVEVRAEFYASGGQLMVFARAETPEGARFEFDGSGEWKLAEESDGETPGDLAAMPAPEGAAAEADEAATDEVARPSLAKRPRRKDIEPVEQWLATLLPGAGLPVTLDSGQPARSYRLDDAMRLSLLEHWSERPAKLACFGNKAMQDLVLLRRAPEFKISYASSGVDWLEVSVSMKEEMEMLTPAEVSAALEQSGSLVRLAKRGTYQREALEAYQKQLETFAELGIELDGGTQRLHAFQIAGAELDALGGESDTFERFAEQARAVAANFKGIPAARVAKEPAAALRPYQRAGVDFLAWAAKTFGGAVLADDMGLGKTLQVLAAITALRAGKGNKLPSLVVCPASVAHNWQREAARFAPSLKTVVIERGAERKAILENLGTYDLVVKNYALTRRDNEYLKKQPWLMVCVDEAQAIKNPDADITRVVKGLNARYRVALTGTPIENRIMDLWSIADFAVPGYLGSRSRFEERAKGGETSTHKYLRSRLRPVLLRRLKQEVAPELPPRIEERLDCEMTSKQRQAYVVEMKRARELLAKRPDPALKGQSRIQMLAALTRLRQICCDPRLRGLSGLGSGKMQVLLEMLPPLLEAGHKVLIFSQFVEMLKLIEPEIGKLGVPCYKLTGQTTKRQELVERFEADTSAGVFLISLKAGGTGLNLTSASHVVLFDPWWNPAAEAQAIDRTHRIGQDKTVLAFRLVTTDTIEERILGLQERKRDLVKNILEAEAFNRSLTPDDFDFLLREG
jgi:superfamily II DNA or RNA helicase